MYSSIRSSQQQIPLDVASIRLVYVSYRYQTDDHLQYNIRIDALRSVAYEPQCAQCSFKVSTEQKHNGQFICKHSVVGAKHGKLNVPHLTESVVFSVVVSVWTEDNQQPLHGTACFKQIKSVKR